MDKERGVGSAVGLKKYGTVVPVLGRARLKRGFAKTTGSVSISSWMGHVPVSLWKLCVQGKTSQGHHCSRSHGTTPALAAAKHLHALVSHHVNTRFRPSTGNPASIISTSGWAGSPILPKNTRFPLKIPAFLERASTTSCAKYVRMGVTALIVRGIPETTPPSSKHFSSRGQLV